MSIPNSVTQLLATLVLVVPGFVFQGVRIRLRGRTPSDTEFTTRILNAIAVSTAFALGYVLVLGSTIVSPDHLQNDALHHPRKYALLGIGAAFVVPALIAYLVVRVSSSQSWQRAHPMLLSDTWTRIDPRPSGWDVAFHDVSPCYVRVQMRDGTWFAGWFGEDSYASSWPDPHSLFVQVSMQISSDGTIGAPVGGSSGAVIDCTDAVLVELLAPPEADPSGTMSGKEASS